MTLRATILGCGSSGGVPRIGGDWGLCDPNNPKNNRRRCSLLLERTEKTGVTRVLIDTSPDMREQMLAAKVESLDAVWYTHEHADHTHGIDEVRGFYLRQRRRVPIWADAATLSMLTTRFSYCFSQPQGSDYPPIMSAHLIERDASVSCNGPGGIINAETFTVTHGNIDVLGFKFGNTVYTPDINAIPEASLKHLEGLDLWIVDALKRTGHPSHFSLTETLSWIERLKPRRAVLTNMHNDLDYETLLHELPPHVEPACDGMVLDLS
jgi:phosphoribosyl 1,2-cyclic phosphate phosphodiesterase